MLCPTLATLWTIAHQAPLSMGFTGKNTGVGCHFLLQGIFPAQRSNHNSCVSCIDRWILYHPTTWQALREMCSSVAQWCPTLCDPMNRSTPGLPVHHQLPEFAQTHVHRVGDGHESDIIHHKPSLLYYNSFIILFTQIIHKTQTQKIGNIFNLTGLCCA